MTKIDPSELLRIWYLSPKGAKMLKAAGLNDYENLVKRTTNDLYNHADPSFLANVLTPSKRQLFINSIVLAQTYYRTHWTFDPQNPNESGLNQLWAFVLKKRNEIRDYDKYPLCIPRSVAEILVYSNILYDSPDLICPHSRILRDRAVETLDKVTERTIIGHEQGLCVYGAIIQIMAYRQDADPLHPPVNIPMRSPPN